MQFRDLKKQYQVLKDRIDAACAEVMARGAFISGEEVSRLEDALAKYVGVKHCVTCANGTDALSLALMAWGIGKNDAVFVPDFTFFASGEVVPECGATPIFVDVEPDTFNIDAEKLERAILRVLEEGILTPRVIVAVDLFGLPANYPALSAIADRYNMYILEDAAQGFGGELEGKRACSFGDISTTSFFPAKPLGCYGDGGAIFTDDDEIASLLRSLCVHGKGSFKYDNIRIGRNSRLDTLQAAILEIKLDAFEKYERDAVNTAAGLYTKALCDTVKTPVVPSGYLSSWAQYTLTLESRGQRDGLQAYLKENGIPSMVYYPKPMHCQKAFENTAPAPVDLSVTTCLCDTVLSLPMHPYLEKEDIDFICAKVKEYIKKEG